MADTILPPDHLDAMLESVEAAIRFGDAATALELVDAAQTMSPGDGRAALLRARVLDDLGRLDEARAALEQLAAHRGDLVVVWQRLGDVALRVGDSERAVEAYRQWQRLEGPTGDNETALALAYLADLDLNRARAHADAAVHVGAAGVADDLAARLALLDDEAALESEAGWWLCTIDAGERGRALLAASLERRDEAETRRRLGAALALDGRVDDAIPHFRAAVVDAPDRLSWRAELGTALLLTGDVDGAADCFDRVLTVAPGDVVGTIGAARVAIQRGDTSQAVELADTLLDVDARHADAWVVRSQAHLAADRHLQALVDAEHAVAATPNDRSVWLAASSAAESAGAAALAGRYGASATIRLSGSLGLAEGEEFDDLPSDITDELPELDRLVVADPRVRTIYRCRAMIADALFHPARSLAYLDAAIDRGVIEDTVDVRCDRAALSLGMGALDDARAGFQAVLDERPDFPRAVAGLAEVERRRPRPAEPAPWSPTHRAPPIGLSAFAGPGGGQVPSAQLPPGLPVELLERADSWAHLRCENGWECWATAVLLVPIGGAWAPTHRIPSGGLLARTAPSEQADDAGAINGGLEVEVFDRVDGWAHVRFENDWTCWVAHDALEPGR